MGTRSHGVRSLGRPRAQGYAETCCVSVLDAVVAFRLLVVAVFLRFALLAEGHNFASKLFRRVRGQAGIKEML